MKDKQTEEQKKFLAAVKDMMSSDKDVIREFQGLPPKEKESTEPVKEAVVDEPQEDKLTQLILKQREANERRQAEEEMIRQHMLYSKAAGANPAPGVIPAVHLGYTQQDPDRGSPIGVDLNQLPLEQRKALFDRLPPAEQEAFIAKVEASRRGDR